MSESGRTEEPPEAGSGRRALDWGAVAALSGVVAALVALVAYLLPPDAPRPAPSPPPVPVARSSPERTSARPHSPAPTPTPGPAGSPEAEPEPEPDSAPEPDPAPGSSRTADVPVPLPAVVPAGCREASAAVAAYRRDQGSTRGAQADAANLAYQGLMRAGTDADPPVRPTVVRLAQEFQELGFRLSGMVLADPNEVVADINADLPVLDRQCAGGS
ncbi:hypothetical protein K353_03630 [Kitasatospora sp. SolWspMP-SS2h]|uniref:hypothetical protein n=1 Tax=Kitasatospora sp. SolWspMP-SS2h TaxID=1305729 RepID=UPI000DBFD404|nr:hypothetical protein [Kitasatospora sp. SolWspMP-SS2h]RAJ40142.1 hypothetical protein K353_03630 [Kitasatospora sp. SolWspMP-SS2h]